jgi:hypothetical protein
MAKIESLLSEDAVIRKRRIRMVVSIIIGVVLLHLAGGIVAGVFIVAKYIFPPPANFVVKKDIRLPAKKREQKMNMAAVDAIAPKPTLNDKMQSSRPTAFSLPDVPDMPLDQMLPLDPSQLLTDQLASLSNTESLGTSSGVGSAGGGGFGGKGISFLGVDASGDRVLLMFDVSQRVVKAAAEAGYPFANIKEETIGLFKKLPITARFGVVVFNTPHESFRKELAPNNNTNRNAVIPWIEGKFGGAGVQAPPPKTNRQQLLGVLDLAQRLKPDLLIILTQGDYHPGFSTWPECKKVIEELKDENGKPSKINFILFNPSEHNLKELKKIASGAENVTVSVKK